MDDEGGGFLESLPKKTVLDSKQQHFYHIWKNKTISRKRDIKLAECTHLRRFRGVNSSKSAVIYLSLVEDGCSKKDAKIFSSKPRCRTDITKKIDGPKDFRNLKVGINPIAPHINVRITPY